MKSPYDSAPARAFWSRAVSRKWEPTDLVTKGDPFVRRGEKVVSAGSCFAANLVPYLENSGFRYLQTEVPPPAFTEIMADNFSYDKFSARYGNIYTVRQLLQLMKRALGQFQPYEDRWNLPERFVDPFRPGLRHAARSTQEFDALSRQHLKSVLRAFTEADVLIFTLGLTEAWIDSRCGSVFPACPGTVAGSFDSSHHVFHNFSVSEVVDDLRAFVGLLRSKNPGVRLILTVSPVPLVATATDDHVLTATLYSKSVLRAAAGEVANQDTRITYFPAYEIVTGPQAPEGFFERDRRNPSRAAIDAVMRVFLANCDSASSIDDTPSKPKSNLAILSGQVTEAECEEAMQDGHAYSSPSSVKTI